MQGNKIEAKKTPGWQKQPGNTFSDIAREPISRFLFFPFKLPYSNLTILKKKNKDFFTLFFFGILVWGGGGGGA